MKKYITKNLILLEESEEDKNHTNEIQMSKKGLALLLMTKESIHKKWNKQRYILRIREKRTIKDNKNQLIPPSQPHFDECLRSRQIVRKMVNI